MANTGIVGALKVLLGLDTAEFDAGLKGTKAKAKGLETDFSSIGSSLSRALLPAAGFAGVALGLANLARSAVQTAGRVSDLADQTGLSIQSIQEMDAAAKLTSTSLEGFTNAAFKLGVNLASGTDKVRNAVDALGLSYEALRVQSPDQQFKTIATALGEVEDKQLRNKLAVELFGRGAKEILPAIAQGYDQIADSAGKAGDEQIRALDAAGDAWTSFWNKAKALSTSVMGQIVINFRDSWEFMMIAPRQALEEWSAALEAMGLKSVSTLPKAFGQARVAASLLPPVIDKITMSLEEQHRIEKDLTKSVEKKIAITVKGLADAEEAQRKWNESILSVNRSGFAMLQWMEPFKEGIHDIGQEIENIRQGFTSEGLIPSDVIGENIESIREADAALLKWAHDHGAVLVPAVQQSGSALTEASKDVQTWGESIAELSRAFSELAQITSGALSDFVSWIGTVTGAINLAEKAGKSLRSGYEKLGGDLKSVVSGFIQLAAAAASAAAAMDAATSSSSRAQNAIGGAAIGAQIGSQVGGPVGGIIGGVGGFLIGLFRKPTDEAAAFRKELIKQHGSLQNLEAIAKPLGISFAEIWGVKGKKGAELLEAALKKLNAALDDQKRKLEEQRVAWESELDAARSGLDGLIGDASEMGYEFDRNGNLVSVSFRKMKEIAEKFGVSLEALGPQFHSDRITADAMEIWNAITLLAKGGTDAGTILSGLKDEIGHLVSESIKFGTKIPENMRPWIQNLIDTGQLIDDNGQKITDISQINFGPEIESEFDIVAQAIRDSIRAINDLIARIEALIGTILAIPDKTVKINYETTGTPPGEPPVVGDPPDDEIVPMSAPSRPSRPLSGLGNLVGAFPAEALSSAMDAARSLSNFDPSSGLAASPAFAGSAAASGNASTVRNYFSFEIHAIDGADVEQVTRSKIMPQIRRDLSNNTGGARTGFKNDLGI